MPIEDKRNVLHIGPLQHHGQTEITPAMVEDMRQRIKDSGGALDVWAVLHEDAYETTYGDGLYLHVRGLALNSADAEKLAALGGGDSEWVKWHICSYRIVLENDLPVFMGLERDEEEFNIGQFVILLSEIPPGGTASKLLTGTGLRKDGPLLSLE